MEQYFATMFEVFRQERSLKLLLSLIDPHKQKQNKFTDLQTNEIKNFALENLHRVRMLKESKHYNFKNSNICFNSF